MTQYSLFGDDNIEEEPKKVAKVEATKSAPKPPSVPESKVISELETKEERIDELPSDVKIEPVAEVIENLSSEVKIELAVEEVENASFEMSVEPEEMQTAEVKPDISAIPLGDIKAEFDLDEKSLEENYVTEVFIFEEPLQELATDEEEEEKVSEKKEKVKAETVTKSRTTRGRLKLSDTHLAASSIEVPEDEILFSKKYYSIGIVAKMFDVNISLLRYWENEFTILKPRKNGKGDRHFRPEDIKNIQLIHHLLREKKYTLEGAKDFLKKTKNTEDPLAIIENLKDLKSFLLEIKTNL